MEKVSRQVRRAMERREGKPEADTITRTSMRWAKVRTKGMPYSRTTIADIIPSKPGIPAVFVTKPRKRNKKAMHITATPHNVGLFVDASDPVKNHLLGVWG